eukprot:2973535-Amphidinium_carterae.2
MDLPDLSRGTEKQGIFEVCHFGSDGCRSSAWGRAQIACTSNEAIRASLQASCDNVLTMSASDVPRQSFVDAHRRLADLEPTCTSAQKSAVHKAIDELFSGARAAGIKLPPIACQLP